MLYDLNVPWTATTSQPEIERTLRFAKNLGYDVVALNQLITTVPKVVVNQIPKLTPPSTTQAQPSSQPTTQSTTRSPATAAAAASLSTQPSKSQLPTTLRRATIIVSDQGATNYKLGEYARAFDLVAVRPTTDKAFSWACLSQDGASIISMDMAAFHPFHFQPRTCMAAVARGLRFEISYGQALQSSTSGGGGKGGGNPRATFISNVMNLSRATKGRGVLVSSEARSALALRAPADVVNLLAVWGLGTDKGTEALGTIPRGIVVNEAIRRSGFRGMVDITQVADGGKEGDEVSAAGTETGKVKQQKNRKGQPANPEGGVKRKNGNGEGVGNDKAGGLQHGTLSNRQAKRQRKATQEAATTADRD
jgi:ribonuclease P/MRP protein subunit RPP1